MIKLDKTIRGVAALAALTLLAACQPKTDSSDAAKAAADASQTPLVAAPAPTSPPVGEGEGEGETERGPGAGDDGAHGPRAMEMGREARERGMGMAPNATPPAEKSPQ